MRLLVVEDDRTLNQQIVTRPRAGGLRRRPRLRRRGGPVPRARPSPTTPPSSISACRRSTASGAQRLAARGAQDAGHHPDRPRPLERQGPGLRCGRRRLRDEALPHGGAPRPRRALLLRRATGHATSEIVCGPVRLDTRSGRVVVDGNPVKLTSHEYRLLSYLMHHTGPHRLARRADRAPLRPGFRPRFEHDRGLHRPPAQEARRRHHPDGARPRLPRRPAEGPGVIRVPPAPRASSPAAPSPSALRPPRCSGASRSCSSRR